MKKIGVILALFVCFFAFDFNFASASNENHIFVVVANSACVYESASLTSKKIEGFKNKDEVELLFDGDNIVQESADGFVFYKLKTPLVEQEVEFSYILSDFVVEKTEVLTSIPNFNAKTTAESKVYISTNGNFVEEGSTLERGQKIFLYQGFDQKREFTAVAYVKNNKVFYGFLKTDEISPNGINPVIITVFSLALAVLGIVFALVFIQRRKIKIKKSA